MSSTLHQRDIGGRPKIIGIEEFIGSYFRLIQVVYTYIYSIFFYLYIIHKEEIKTEALKALEPFLQSFIDIEKKELIKKFKEIKADLDEKFGK